MKTPGPLRIGFLTLDWPPMSGGMARFCFETAVALSRRGHEIVVFAGRGAADEPGMRVTRGLIGDLSHDIQLVRSHEAGIDLWHGWEHGFGGLADQLRAPMVVTVHGNDLFSPKVYYRFAHTPMLHRFAPRMARPAWQRRMCRAGFERVAAFLPNSANTARLLIDHYPECREARVIPCGVSDAFFQSRPVRAPGPKRLLTVCSLSRARPRKNVAGVMHALAMLKDEFEFQYDVIGGGDALEDHRRLADSVGLADRVHFHGAVGDERLFGAYRAADLFVLTPAEGETDVEGFGIAYLEANASGVPVLAVRTGGVPDAVQEGVSGYFADSAQPGDIANALARYFNGGVRLNEQLVRAWAEQHRYQNVAMRVEREYLAAFEATHTPAWLPTAATMPPDTLIRAPDIHYTSHVGNSQYAACKMPSV